MNKMTDLIITHDGDTWRVLAEGATRGGRTFCHLASTTLQAKHPCNPVQIGDWVDNDVLLSAAMQREEAQRKAYNEEKK